MNVRDPQPNTYAGRTPQSHDRCHCPRQGRAPCEQPAGVHGPCVDCLAGCAFVVGCYDRLGGELQHTWHGRGVFAVQVGGFHRAWTRAQITDLGWLLPGDSVDVTVTLGETP